MTSTAYCFVQSCKSRTHFLKGLSSYTSPQHSMMSSSSRDSSNRSHYQVLGVQQSASKKDIRDAFVELSKKHHPDTRTHDSSHHDEFIKVADAYKVLSNEELKREYDYTLLREMRPNLPQSHQPMAQYYKDGTIYNGPISRHKPRFKNSQIVTGAVIFAMIGGFLQLCIALYFHRRRAAKADAIHLDALDHIAKIKNLASTGQTALQLNLDQHRSGKP